MAIFLVIAPTLLVPPLIRPSGAVIGATTTTLYATEDAYTNSSTPTANHASDQTLVVQTPQTYAYAYAYVKFDTSSIPKDATITSATLSLYLESGSRWAGPYGNAKIGAHRCDQDQDQAWDEQTLTWENQPDSATQPTDKLSLGLLVFTGYKSWTITQDVQSSLETGSLTEVLKFTDGTGTVLLGSRESAHKPRLVVEYSQQPIANITLRSAQDSQATTNQGYITFSETEAQLPAQIQAVHGTYPIQYQGGTSRPGIPYDASAKASRMKGQDIQIDGTIRLKVRVASQQDSQRDTTPFSAQARDRGHMKVTTPPLVLCRHVSRRISGGMCSNTRLKQVSYHHQPRTVIRFH